MSVKLSASRQKNGLEGAWLTLNTDNVHVHTATGTQETGGKPGIVIGYDVDNCKGDNASRLALSLVDGLATVQVVDPSTKKVTQKEVPASVVYEELKKFLEKLATYV